MLGVSKIVIERPAKNAKITIYTARPGVVIGKKGEDIEVLRAELRKRMGLPDVALNIEEVRKPEIDAQLIADSITSAAGKTHHVPPCHEARDAECDAPGRAGHQDHERGPPERHRNRTYRMVSRRPCAVAHPACRYRLRVLRSEDHLRRHRHQGVGVQGRTCRRRKKLPQPAEPPNRKRESRKSGAKHAAAS